MGRLPIAPEYKVRWYFCAYVCVYVHVVSTYIHASVSHHPTNLQPHLITTLPTLKKPQVMRVWFDQQLSGHNGTIDILETPDFAPVNLIAQYHLLEDECAAWANKTGGALKFWDRGGL